MFPPDKNFVETFRFSANNPNMVKPQDGYHNVNTQIPKPLWDALCADAEKSGESATRVLTRILQKHYKLLSEDLPKPRRMGRPPKKK